MIDAMHRRLHVGFDTLRRLGVMASDVPENIRGGKAHSCIHCKTANASHLSHIGSAYKPSYPGRLVQAFDRATRGEIANARRSRKVLILFSGPYRRPDGLAAFLHKLGFETVLLDNDPVTGGGAEGDILNDDIQGQKAGQIPGFAATRPRAYASGGAYIPRKG